MHSKGSEDTDSANRPTTDNLDDLNQIIHSQISTFLAKDAHSPIEHDEVNFDDLIRQIYPDLWSAICLLNRSTSERRDFKGDRPTVICVPYRVR